MPPLEANGKVPVIPQSEGDGAVKKGSGIKILLPAKLLTRIPVLVLAQIKAGNNSSELKNKIRQILYFLYLYNEINDILIR